MESVVGDALEPSLAEALRGAAVVYHCANAPYHRWTQDLPGVWRGIVAAAAEVGARLVVATNLYSLGMPSGPFTEVSAMAPCSEKGRVRAALESEILTAHGEGRLTAALVRASDFYGPEVFESQLGNRFFPPLLSGKPASLTGVPSARHSYTYLPDFARTLAEIGVRDDVWGKSWIVPTATAVNGNELRDLARRSIPGARIRFTGKAFLRFGGLFVPAARELVEMFYEFDRDFEVDSTATEDKLGITATPLDRGLAKTIEWYRAGRQAETERLVRS